MKEEKLDKVNTVNKDHMISSSTEKSNGLKLSKVSPKSLKKDGLPEDEFEQFNEVLDDHIPENDNDMLKNDTITGNTTSDQEDSNQPVAQRAKRDINFNDLGQQIGHFVTGLVRTIRDTGRQALSLDKRLNRYRVIKFTL